MVRKKSLLMILSGPHLAFLALLAAGGYFLWTEHQAHLLAALPYLFLLVCPLMHVFMHGSYGHHSQNQTDERSHHGPYGQ